MNEGTRTTRRMRPCGLSAGTTALIGAWFVGAAIARLTGAAAVLLVLAAGAVALAASVLSSVWSLRGVTTLDLDIVGRADVDVPVSAGLRVNRLPAQGDVRVRVLHGESELGRCDRQNFDGDGHADVSITFPVPGIIDHVDLEVIVSGAPGLFRMRRTSTVGVGVGAGVEIAPAAHGPHVDIATASSNRDGVRTAKRGPSDGDVDGVRPWREGESHSSVHWSSTLRTGSLIVRDRPPSSDECWTLTLPDERVDIDTAARLLFTAVEGLRLGHEVTVTTPSSTQVLPDVSAARSLAAHSIGRATPPLMTRTPWHRRSVHLGARRHASRPLDPVSRVATALTSLIAIGMLIGSLGSSPTMLVLAALGLGLGVGSSMRFGTGSNTGGTKPWWLQLVIAAATLAALGYVGSTVGGVSGLLAALRGPMPDLLLLLLIVHGLEVVDQRTQRVHQAIASIVVAYAAGLRVDGNVGLWLAAWAIMIVIAVRTSTRTTESGRVSVRLSNRRFVNGAGLLTAGSLAVLALLSVVPVPDGPARLGLPALSNDAPSPATPGALAGPSGAPPAPSTERRGSLGEVGGYPGFSETLDTSVRGDLGDDLVMRVRASEPAFWRGQTFTEFNGRTWSVSPDEGVRRTGPRIDVPATLGDLPRRDIGIETEEFIQTYYVESDLPNVVFAAARPDVVTFDGSIWTRPDGSMRSNVTLTEGSVYTVVSERLQVTPDLLHQQGDIALTFTELSNAALLEPYLVVPDSTTQRTIDLATELRLPGDSTYQTILRYQRWLGENTAYDLNAPVPAPGADAVDDYLFESRRGFCEQIASSLAIMLRSQGVPARIATGYVPGERNRVSGVFEVRAKDAHAWVEVWFPDTGWESFDPTAQVPLAGDAQQGTVGGDLISAAIGGVASHPVKVGLLVGLGILMVGTVRTLTQFVARRRRGRWGVLQDRFNELGPSTTTNPLRAQSFEDPRHLEIAGELADLLDRVAFDPAWIDDDETYRRARERVDSLL